MSKDVKVILLEDIKPLGRAGDIVTISEGYARNQLFPEGKAALATEQTVNARKKEEANQSEAKQAELTQLRKQAEKFEGTELAMEVKVSEGSDIYGSIKDKDIAAELNSAGLTITPRQVTANTPIKKLGTYDISISLSREVEFAMKLAVVPDKSSKPALESKDE